MSTEKKIIAVIGATGIQGGSIVKTLLADSKMSSEWAIRGITRDASKDICKNLASQGVEIITWQANLDSKDSLLAAFEGVYAIFAVTNYFETLVQEIEVQQGMNLADAALESGVQHFIWSSLPNVTELTNGALKNVYHFDSKAKVEAYIRTTALPATYLMPGFYMNNLPGQVFKQSPPDNAWTLGLPVPSTAPVPLFAAIEDTGKFVKAILNHRDETLGKRVLAATKYYTLDEMITTFKEVFPEAGETAGFYKTPHEEYLAWFTDAGLPDYVALELLEMIMLLDEGGYFGGDSLEWSHSLLDEPLTTWEEYIKSSEIFANLK
ncbi:hypothetical protein VTL71DRAFT_13173 [Oculimacula yallundae]|uniref:NmrA-like domain-containing protein n=1 Tax=Oculimacula yallundae TaxID=86028 RepID=A0ABR4CJK3_9HELO